MKKQCTAVNPGGAGGRKTQLPANWGHRYTHFFYALTPHLPFEMMGVSVILHRGKQNPQDCWRPIHHRTGVARVDAFDGLRRQ